MKAGSLQNVTYRRSERGLERLDRISAMSRMRDVIETEWPF